MTDDRRFGIVGVFASSEPMVTTAHRLRAIGLEAVDAYTPYPVEELGEAIPPTSAWVLPRIMAGGALVGACFGYFIQYWDEWINYPINVGGRPHNSWPAFTVGAFEITLLFTVAAGFFGLWFACRLPRLYDPKLDAPAFDRASTDRFVLRVEAGDRGVAPETIRKIFEDCGAEQIVEVSA